MEDTKHKNRIMYLGKYLDSANVVAYKYIEITEENNVGKNWNFNKKIFKKGAIGSVYDCTLKEGTINYNATCIPTTLLKNKDGSFSGTFVLFDFLYETEEDTRQIDIQIRNSKKSKSTIDVEIDEIKRLYRNLSPAKRSAFIGNLIYKITK